MRIHHIGYLVDDIENAAIQFEHLGFSRIGKSTHDSSREVYILLLDNAGIMVDLVQPTSEQSPIYGLRKRYRNSPYHICYETENISATINLLEKHDGGGIPYSNRQPLHLQYQEVPMLHF